MIVRPNGSFRCRSSLGRWRTYPAFSTGIVTVSPTNFDTRGHPVDSIVSRMHGYYDKKRSPLSRLYRCEELKLDG